MPDSRTIATKDLDLPMTSFAVPTVDTSAALRLPQTVAQPQVLTNLFKAYCLQWRQQVLFVSLHRSSQQVTPAPVAQLTTRLANSPIRHVCIDAAIGDAHVTAWAQACRQAGKSLYVRPRTAGQAQATSSWSRQLLNTILNPVLTVVAELVNAPGIEPVLYKQWTVGQRGKVFQAWNVRTLGAMLA